MIPDYEKLRQVQIGGMSPEEKIRFNDEQEQYRISALNEKAYAPEARAYSERQKARLDAEGSALMDASEAQALADKAMLERAMYTDMAKKGAAQAAQKVAAIDAKTGLPVSKYGKALSMTLGAGGNSLNGAEGLNFSPRPTGDGFGSASFGAAAGELAQALTRGREYNPAIARGAAKDAEVRAKAVEELRQETDPQSEMANQLREKIIGQFAVSGADKKFEEQTKVSLRDWLNKQSYKVMSNMPFAGMVGGDVIDGNEKNRNVGPDGKPLDNAAPPGFKWGAGSPTTQALRNDIYKDMTEKLLTTQKISGTTNEILYGDTDVGGSWPGLKPDSTGKFPENFWNSVEGRTLAGKVSTMLLDYQKMYGLGALQKHEEDLINRITGGDVSSLPFKALEYFANKRYSPEAVKALIQNINREAWKSYEQSGKVRKMEPVDDNYVTPYMAESGIYGKSGEKGPKHIQAYFKNKLGQSSETAKQKQEQKDEELEIQVPSGRS